MTGAMWGTADMSFGFQPVPSVLVLNPGGNVSGLWEYSSAFLQPIEMTSQSFQFYSFADIYKWMMGLLWAEPALVLRFQKVTVGVGRRTPNRCQNKAKANPQTMFHSDETRRVEPAMGTSWGGWWANQTGSGEKPQSLQDTLLYRLWTFYIS